MKKPQNRFIEEIEKDSAGSFAGSSENRSSGAGVEEVRYTRSAFVLRIVTPAGSRIRSDRLCFLLLLFSRIKTKRSVYSDPPFLLRLIRYLHLLRSNRFNRGRISRNVITVRLSSIQTKRYGVDNSHLGAL